MGDRATKGRLGISPLNIYMNPLVIASRISKLLDTLLANSQPITHMRFCAGLTLQIGQDHL
jgi:hypothetical protein